MYREEEKKSESRWNNRMALKEHFEHDCVHTKRTFFFNIDSKLQWQKILI